MSYLNYLVQIIPFSSPIMNFRRYCVIVLFLSLSYSVRCISFAQGKLEYSYDEAEASPWVWYELWNTSQGGGQEMLVN